VREIKVAATRNSLDVQNRFGVSATLGF